MRQIYEEIIVKCVKENSLMFNVGQDYQIVEVSYDNKTGNVDKVICDNIGSTTNKSWMDINTFDEIFELPYSFEEEVIDVILNTIKDNQEYLTQPENLPQLAKLGYMYNLLWYAGRVCWGSDGILSGKNGTYDCEDNPKYKIEMCEPKNEKIENLIYDAWGMHVSNDLDTTNYDKFIKILFEERELTELEVKMLKVNKTFDEWVEVLTDENYTYSSIYPTRRSVADHLLCVIGNGYGMNKDGFVISEASGADQDRALYGDWENAKFSPEIEKIVRDLVSLPSVKQTIDAASAKAQEWKDKQEQDDKKRLKMFIGTEISQEEFDTMTSKKLWDKIFKSDNLSKKLDSLLGKSSTKEKKEEYRPYYPICNYSVIDIMINENSKKRIGIKNVHQSYIDAGIEICKEIVAHEDKEDRNIEFARKFLALQGVEGYQEFVPEKVDIDAIIEQIKDNFSSVSYNNLHLNDTRKNEYADDNAYVTIQTKPDEPMIMGVSNSIEYIKGSKLYEVLKPALDKTAKMKEVHQLYFYYQNTDRFHINIKIILNKKYVNLDMVESDKDFIKQGFMIGDNIIAKPLNNYIMVSKKPEPLGSKHPHNKSGKEYYSQAKYFQICDKNWKVLLDFHIDERGFNTFQTKTHTVKNEEVLKLKNVLIEEFANLKASDKSYGSYDSQTRNNKDEGKRKLYVHEFMNWMESKYSRKAKLDNLKNEA